ncbi:MAG TPA: tetratricopeptide repeat protein, partial [Verrucomicrobiae bacterium]|nr:tetratricopeptide repeat protein [Verrucomicrobiae bacterium]
HLAWTFYIITALLLCWQCVLFLRAGPKSRGFAWEYVPVRSHYVQASVQFAIYLYWGWYWRNVYTEFPLILAQVAFLYAIDGLLSWSRGQTWRLGFGPWPIIFSTNLFMWFRDDWFWLQFLMVATGLLGKQFVRWKRDGKITHIFNPSAFGLTIFSLMLIFTGTTNCTWGQDIAITQGRPPHIYLEMFLCGMVVQYFFYVTLLTFSAAGMVALLSLAYTPVTGVYLFVDSNIPIAVFLGLHLLMTDPATTPRSSVGRVFFGSLYGLGVFFGFILLNALHLPEFYDKLIVVPFLNLLTPVLDRLASLGLAGKYGRWEGKVSPYKMNLAYMTCWIAVFFIMLATGFVEGPHPGATIAFWKKAAEENRPHALDNLRLLLAEFERRNMDDPAEGVTVTGAGGPISRRQALGILCDQVATIYAEGKLVPADPARAAHYFGRSCEYGTLEGCANLALLHYSATNIQCGPDVVRAVDRLEQSCAETPDGRISFIVGESYELGQGRAMDKARARHFYEQGAALGDLAACKSAARMQLAGDGGTADHAAAAQSLQKAADQQDGPSCLNLARMYHVGDGVAKDEQKAVSLLEQACQLGMQPACDILKQSQR